MVVAIKSGQTASGISAASSTTLATACVLPAAPTSGNLLVFCMAGDKATGTITMAGWTQQHIYSNTSVSIYMLWKVSNGTETSVNCTWGTSSAAGNTAELIELEDTDISGSGWLVSGSANSGTYSDTAVNARVSGTTGTLLMAGLAVGAWGVDSGTSVSGARVYTNSYVEKGHSETAAGRGAVFTATLSVASGTTSCSFSYTGTADQIHGCVTVFSKAALAYRNRMPQLLAH